MRSGSSLVMLALVVSCKHDARVTATLEEVLNKSCLPTLPIPNRPPFDIVVEAATASAVRLRLQQLPDAFPTPNVTAERSGQRVRLRIQAEELLEGSTFCDVIVRIDGLTPGSYTIEVEEVGPGTAPHVVSLGEKTALVSP